MNRIFYLAASTLIAALADPTVAGAKSGCADLGGNIQAGNVCRVYSATPAYILDIRFRTDYVDGQVVADYLTQERDRLVNAAQAPGAQNLPDKLMVTWQYYSSGQRLGNNRAELGYGAPPHGTQSLVLKALPTIDGNPAEDYFKSFTYDLNLNRPVTLENLFAPGINPMDAIYPAAKVDLERSEYAWSFKLTPSVGRDPAHYQNFAITDDAVIFFFREGELLTRQAGNAQATVSRANLPPLQL